MLSWVYDLSEIAGGALEVDSRWLHFLESRRHVPTNRNPTERPVLARSISGAACRLPPSRGVRNRGGVCLSCGSGSGSVSFLYSYTPRSSVTSCSPPRIVTWGDSSRSPALSDEHNSSPPLPLVFVGRFGKSSNSVCPSPFVQIASPQPPPPPVVHVRFLVLTLLVSRVRRADDVQVTAMSLAALAAHDLNNHTHVSPPFFVYPDEKSRFPSSTSARKNVPCSARIAS